MRSAGGYDVLLTGGSSPLGDHLVPELVSAGLQVLAAVRTSGAAEAMRARGLDVLHHDLDAHELPPALEATVVLHVAGIRHAAAAAALAERAGASSLVAISSASATAPGHPQRVEILQAEDTLRALPIRVNVLRPTMIYGSARDRNIRRLYRLIQRMPRVPRFNGGGLVMPVLVDDLVQAVLESLRAEEPFVRPVGGPTPVRLGQIVDELCGVGARARLPLTIPLNPVARAAHGVRQPGKALHALQMLTQDRVVPAPREIGFSYSPTDLRDGIRLAVGRYDGPTCPSALA